MIKVNRLGSFRIVQGGDGSYWLDAARQAASTGQGSEVQSAIVAYARSKNRHNFTFHEVSREIHSRFSLPNETLLRFKQRVAGQAMHQLVLSGRLQRTARAVYMYVW